MNKTRAFLLALLTLAVGFGVGARCTLYYSGRQQYYLEITSQEQKADVAVRALGHLRGGSTNTTEFLETQLDEAVVRLSHILADRPQSSLTASDVRMLVVARDYRARFPRKSSQTDRDEEIAKAFTLIQKASH